MTEDKYVECTNNFEVELELTIDKLYRVICSSYDGKEVLISNDLSFIDWYVLDKNVKLLTIKQ